MKAPWTKTSTDVLAECSVNPEMGLTDDEAKKRIESFGVNKIQLKKKKSRWKIFFKQINDPIIYVLLAATLIAFFLEEHLDGWAILAIVFLNSVIGYFQESKAEASLEALAAMSAPKGKVLRSGRVVEVSSEDIALGDILVLEAGDYVMADARIISAHQLSVNESVLTGESLPIEKGSDPIDEMTPLSERNNMVFGSTAINSGTGRAVIIAIGRQTEIGKVAGLMEEAEVPATPLQKRLAIVGRYLLSLGLVIIGVVIFIGFLHGKPLIEVLMSALSLSIAAIPEGLPTVVSIALVMAIRRMSGKKALIRKMDAVETLGATDIICTDKTGTLTTGKMEVRHYYLISEDLRDHFFMNMILCNNASPEGMGDSTEVALLNFSESEGHSIDKIQSDHPRLFEWSFDSTRKSMSVAIQDNQGVIIYGKGAPENILEKCNISDGDRKEVDLWISEYSKKGMRLLAFAYKRAKDSKFHTLHIDQVERDFIFLGLVAMADPPRKETLKAIKKCQSSGIKIVMITGDHPSTALAIAYELGIAKTDDEKVVTGIEMDQLSERELIEVSQNASVYARVSPENKLMLVNALKAQNYVVAMTGDGVNDAPALKAASIGVSMGRMGTEVARQASSMVLTDDNFASIVNAIEEGRAVNGNIKRTLQYLLSTNLAELLFILISLISGWPIPLLPVNILWLNLVTDGLPALALAAEKIPKGYLETSHRPSPDSFFDKNFYVELFIVGFIITSMNLFIYNYGLDHYGIQEARTISFAFLVYVVLFRSLSCRSETKTLFEMKPNRYILLAVLIPVVLQIVIHQVEFLRTIFSVNPISFETHLILLTLALIPLSLVEVFKLWRRK